MSLHNVATLLFCDKAICYRKDIENDKITYFQLKLYDIIYCV